MLTAVGSLVKLRRLDAEDLHDFAVNFGVLPQPWLEQVFRWQPNCFWDMDLTPLVKIESADILFDSPDSSAKLRLVCILRLTKTRL